MDMQKKQFDVYWCRESKKLTYLTSFRGASQKDAPVHHTSGQYYKVSRSPQSHATLRSTQLQVAMVHTLL
jgi:hypothetical protein